MNTQRKVVITTTYNEMGIIIDTKAEEVVQPDTTTHDSIPAETGGNDGDRTSGDCISRQQAIDTIKEIYEWHDSVTKERIIEHFKQLPSIQPDTTTDDLISRQAVKDIFTELYGISAIGSVFDKDEWADICETTANELPSVQPDLGKYEYHYDHTDCIWYRPEARNRCPVTCAQYRDGWNDAMNYIFRDGKGYRPYRRGEQYEE